MYIYIYIYGGFLQWWYPTTMGFPTKNDHFGVFWGYHHFRKHPYTVCVADVIIYSNVDVKNCAQLTWTTFHDSWALLDSTSGVLPDEEGSEVHQKYHEIPVEFLVCCHHQVGDLVPTSSCWPGMIQDLTMKTSWMNFSWCNSHLALKMWRQKRWNRYPVVKADGATPKRWISIGP